MKPEAKLIPPMEIEPFLLGVQSAKKKSQELEFNLRERFDSCLLKLGI